MLFVCALSLLFVKLPDCFGLILCSLLLFSDYALMVLSFGSCWLSLLRLLFWVVCVIGFNFCALLILLDFCLCFIG